MKKRLLFLLIIIFCNEFVSAQEWRSKYDEIGRFLEGVARVKKAGKYGFVDSAGKEIVEPIYDNFDYSFTSNGSLYFRKLFRVSVNGKYGYMNRAGKIIVPLEYDEVAISPGLFDAPTAVKKNGKWGFVDVTNSRIVIPCNYDSYGHGYSLSDKKHIPYFELDGYVVLKKGEMAGALDKNGAVIIPFEYEMLSTYGAEDNEIIGRKYVDGDAYSFHYSYTGKFLKRKKMK